MDAAPLTQGQTVMDDSKGIIYWWCRFQDFVYRNHYYVLLCIIIWALTPYIYASKSKLEILSYEIYWYVAVPVACFTAKIMQGIIKRDISNGDSTKRSINSIFLIDHLQ